MMQKACVIGGYKPCLTFNFLINRLRFGGDHHMNAARRAKQPFGGAQHRRHTFRVFQYHRNIGRARNTAAASHHDAGAPDDAR